MIPIYKPYLDKYKKSALEAIESGWVSNHGKYIELATNELKKIVKNNVILMSSGTDATHCLLLALKYKYPLINKIYVPNNVYVAVYNCVLMVYDRSCIEVLDINKDTWNMEYSKEYLLTLEPNSAIMIVHNLGNIINVDFIKQIRPDIILVEDGCEGLFGYSFDKIMGSSNSVLATSVSFYGNKTITSGEGGGFFTHDLEVYNYIKKVYSQGMSQTRYLHDVLAYNYRMTNIQAALLYDQLLDIDHILQLKKKIFDNYDNLLSSDNRFVLQKLELGSVRSNWIYAIRIKDLNINIYDYFYKNNIEIRPFFYCCLRHEHLKDLKIKDNLNLEISEMLNREIIMLPSYPELTFENQIHIVDTLKNLF